MRSRATAEFGTIGSFSSLRTGRSEPHVSGRLQRLFGVSKLSIDPQIVGTTNTAQATLTLQQQITPNVTFTYIQDVTQSNPQIIRGEWAINPRYSAVAQRDVNVEITVNLFYKKLDFTKTGQIRFRLWLVAFAKTASARVGVIAA